MERLRENKSKRSGRVNKLEHLSTDELLICMTSAVDNLVSVFNDSVAMCENQDEDNVRLVAQ